MKRKRITLEVDLDLDPMFGAMYTPESARDQVEAVLIQVFPHYNPAVTIQKKED